MDHAERAMPINIGNESLEGILLTLNLEKGKNTMFCKYRFIFNKPLLIYFYKYMTTLLIFAFKHFKYLYF